MTSRLAGVTALRAEIAVTFESGGDVRSASGALVAKKPDRVRMQCWGPFGSTVMDLSVRAGEALLYLPRENRAVQIDLGRLKNEPGADGDYRALLLVDSLLDELSTSDLAHRLEDDPSPGQGSILLLEDDEPVSRIVFSRATLLPLTRERLTEPCYVIHFSDYRLFGEYWWPGLIRVDAGERQLEVEIESLETNPEFEGDLFEILLPPEVEVESR